MVPFCTFSLGFPYENTIARRRIPCYKGATQEPRICFASFEDFDCRFGVSGFGLGILGVVFVGFQVAFLRARRSEVKILRFWVV